MKFRLSMALQDMRGRDGTVVVRKARNGLVAIPHVIPSNPKTNAQTAVRGYLSKATKTFEAMSDAEVAAWKAYANSISFTDPVTAVTYHPTAISAFVQLATKFLQLSPTGTIPLAPPSSDFTGDTITVIAESETPGVLEFTASAANATGVTTELLIQPLANTHRTPDANGYKHGAWKAFTSGSLTTTVSVPVGAYVAAYRFVKNSTGQATDLVTLPVVQVNFSMVDGGNKTSKKAA